MHAIPKYVPGKEVKSFGNYRCPLCGNQATDDEIDTGWVSCPMLGDRMICLGSCIDHQGVARAEFFDEHPDRVLLANLAVMTNRPVSELRRACLMHQLQIVDEQMLEGVEDPLDLVPLRATIERALSQS